MFILARQLRASLRSDCLPGGRWEIPPGALIPAILRGLAVPPFGGCRWRAMSVLRLREWASACSPPWHRPPDIFR